MGYQPLVAKYKIEKFDNFYVIYDVSIVGITHVIGTASTFWGAKRLMKKHIRSKKERPTECYFTENGELINE